MIMDQKEHKKFMESLQTNDVAKKEDFKKHMEDNYKTIVKNRFKNVEKCIKEGIIQEKHRKEYTDKNMAEFVEALAHAKVKNNNKAVILTNNPYVLDKKDILMERHPKFKILNSDKVKPEMDQVIFNEIMMGNTDLKQLEQKLSAVLLKVEVSDEEKEKQKVKDLSYIG